MPDVTVRDGESVETKRDALLAEFWAKPDGADAPKKRGRKPKPPPPVEPETVTETETVETRTPEQIEADINALAQVIAPAVTAIGRRVTSHYQVRAYTDAEGAALAQAGAAVIDKRFPDLGGYAPEVNLALTLGSQVLSRVGQTDETEET